MVKVNAHLSQIVALATYFRAMTFCNDGFSLWKSFGSRGQSLGEKH